MKFFHVPRYLNTYLISINTIKSEWLKEIWSVNKSTIPYYLCLFFTSYILVGFVKTSTPIPIYAWYLKLLIEFIFTLQSCSDVKLDTLLWNIDLALWREMTYIVDKTKTVTTPKLVSLKLAASVFLL